MAIAEHNPSALYKRNKGVAKMSKSSLHDFAKTKESKLPVKKKPSMAMVKKSLHRTMGKA